MNNPFETIDARLSNIENLLLDLKHTPRNTDNHYEPDLIGIKETSLLLGLTVPTLYTKVHHRTIPFRKVKGMKKLFFSRRELLDWVQDGRKPTQNEISFQAKKNQIKK